MSIVCVWCENGICSCMYTYSIEQLQTATTHSHRDPYALYSNVSGCVSVRPLCVQCIQYTYYIAIIPPGGQNERVKRINEHMTWDFPLRFWSLKVGRRKAKRLRERASEREPIPKMIFNQNCGTFFDFSFACFS